MKSNEVHYYDFSGNDSWQLKMIKLINIFNYSIRQIQSTKCILNGVHQEQKNKTKHRDILNSSSRNSNVIESNWKVIHNYMYKKQCKSLLSITCNWKYAQLHITFNYFQICN
jgi:hypothetical protein